jgi:hypothetical protein
MDSRFCEIKLMRAKDLTNRDVFTPKRGDPWREILGIYHDWHELHAEFGQEAISLDDAYYKNLKAMAADAFDRAALYVIVRYQIQETSRDGINDTFRMFYAFDLVEVQSLPAWEPEPREPETRCDECGEMIPESETSVVNSWHAKSCSLHPANGAG